MVTSKGVGLAVPDWPTTFGYNMFLFPVSKWIGGVLFEHTHRLIASTVGFLTIILALWVWRAEDPPSPGSGATGRQSVRNLALIAVAGVILQGILGGLRVTTLRDQIGIFHACIAQAFLALLVLIALLTTRFWRLPLSNSTGLTSPDAKPLRRIHAIAVATTIAIYAQLALGATMRHQHRDLAILDFPTANGAWIPDTGEAALAKINAWRDLRGLSDVSAFQIWLQMLHRFLALLIGVAVVSVCVRIWREARDVPVLKQLSMLWVVGILLQVTLGAWTIWSNKAADIATAHVAVGALMLCLGVSIWAICARMAEAASGRVGALRRPDAAARRPYRSEPFA